MVPWWRTHCNSCGEVTEWLKVPVLKTGKGSRPSWVRIPPSPPNLKQRVAFQFQWQETELQFESTKEYINRVRQIRLERI